MSDVQNLLCVVVRTLPNVIAFSVNLIVPEGFLHFTYLVFTGVMLPANVNRANHMSCTVSQDTCTKGTGRTKGGRS